MLKPTSLYCQRFHQTVLLQAPLSMPFILHLRGGKWLLSIFRELCWNLVLANSLHHMPLGFLERDPSSVDRRNPRSHLPHLALFAQRPASSCFSAPGQSAQGPQCFLPRLFTDSCSRGGGPLSYPSRSVFPQTELYLGCGLIHRK